MNTTLFLSRPLCEPAQAACKISLAVCCKLSEHRPTRLGVSSPLNKQAPQRSQQTAVEITTSLNDMLMVAQNASQILAAADGRRQMARGSEPSAVAHSSTPARQQSVGEAEGASALCSVHSSPVFARHCKAAGGKGT